MTSQIESRRFFLFQALKFLLWGGAVYGFSAVFVSSKLWLATLIVLLFSIPVFISAVYMSTVSRIEKLHKFEPGGLLHRLLSGRLLIYLIWGLWALATAFFMFLQFHTYTTCEWIAFFMAVPLFYGVHELLQRFLKSEVKPHLSYGTALRWARWITPVIMMVFYLLIIYLFVQIPGYPSFDAAIRAHKSALAGAGGSALLEEAVQWLAWYEGAKAYALGKTGMMSRWPALFVVAAGSFTVFLNACLMLSIFLIPGREFRRILNPLVDEAVPSPVSNWRIGISMAVVVVVVWSFYISLVAQLEQWLHANPRVVETRQKLEADAVQIVTIAEMIGDDYVREGTIDKINTAKIEALHRFEISVARMEGEADRAFDRLEVNVDAFLDWYYSVPAEYGRIGMLMVGEIETYLQDKLVKHLQKGDVFRKVEMVMNAAIQENQDALSEYRETVKQLIAENRIMPGDEEIRVNRRMNIADAINPPVFNDKIVFGERMGYSAGGGVAAGLLTGIIIKKIVAKMTAKTTLKLAAKAVAKVVAAKTAGTAGGTAIGATIGGSIGSLVPGAGTAVGAGIGGFIGGVLTTVALDKLLLMLEESMSRADFKKELMAAIEEARIEFKRQLNSGQAALPH